MSIFRINANNGFLVTGGTISRATGLERVMINCQHEVNTLRGEDPDRQDKGMPNFQTVWNGTPNIPDFEFFLRQTLLAVNDVTRVTDFQAEVSSGNLDYSIRVITPFGKDTFTGSVPIGG